MEIREGYMPFKGYKTYYRIVGKKTGNKKPLVLLHGGPGSTHNYFEVLDRLAEEDGRELVMYDQIGCGESYVGKPSGSVDSRNMDRGAESLKRASGTYRDASYWDSPGEVCCFWIMCATISRKD